AFEDDLAGAIAQAVEPIVGVPVLPDGRPVDGNAREKTTGTRVAENLGAQLDVGRRAGIAAHRTGGHRRVRADLELVAHELFEPAAVLDDQHQIDRLPANLGAEAAPGDTETRRRGPLLRLWVARAQNAAAVLPADDETALHQRRKHGNALRLLEDGRGDGLVARVHDLAEHRDGLVDALDFVFLRL